MPASIGSLSNSFPMPLKQPSQGPGRGNATEETTESPQSSANEQNPNAPQSGQTTASPPEDRVELSSKAQQALAQAKQPSQHPDASPENIDRLLSSANSLAVSGQVAQAQKQLSRIIAQYPNTPQAQKAQQLLARLAK